MYSAPLILCLSLLGWLWTAACIVFIVPFLGLSLLSLSLIGFGSLEWRCSYCGLAVLGCQVDCNQVLVAPEGSFSSPCYPRDYPKNQACRWTLQAPAGFVVQITFLDFELEEALRCIYDRLVVNTGSNNVSFCGLTANGLSLNSTGNFMEVSFNSDFSVQKRGFNISYRQGRLTAGNRLFLDIHYRLFLFSLFIIVTPLVSVRRP